MMVELSETDKFREGQVKIKEIIRTKTKAWIESGREISSPSRVAR